MSNLQKRIHTSRLPPMPPAGLGGSHGAKKGRTVGKRDYTASSWDHYYTSKRDLKVGENTFRIYENGTEGPVCLFLHGGGFSALSWSVLAKHLTELVACRCTAIDLRGHGDTTTTEEYSLSADTMQNDVDSIVKALYGEDPPPIILIGHSMGGAISVRVAANNMIPSLIGLAVIDVVEGTALESLSGMQSILRGRPATFKSLENAIEWSVRSGHIRNLESAKISMIGQLRKHGSSLSAAEEVKIQQDAAPVSSSTIAEEEEETYQSTESKQIPANHGASSEFKEPSAPQEGGQYTWRIDLSRTEPYWRGWFEGLSHLFLSCNVPKMLLLAGVDRLDKELTVGQMQGKFQMQVLSQCGHIVHEDVPDKVADILATFMVRHRVAQPTGHFQPTFPAC